MLQTHARSSAFGIYIIAAAAAIVALYLIKMNFAAQIIAYTVCALVFIYWICHMILSRQY
ncbi:MAG: hypothetical protein LIO59_06320 [Oscillospiraceae bacterium]|nr:hypothetical protein [Oscillospiraceae bacterium]